MPLGFLNHYMVMVFDDEHSHNDAIHFSGNIMVNSYLILDDMYKFGIAGITNDIWH